MEERKYKRIIVLGSTGSGKTVLSNSISKRTKPAAMIFLETPMNI